MKAAKQLDMTEEDYEASERMAAKASAIMKAHRADRKLRERGIDVLLGIHTEHLIQELKRRGLGVFNLSLPFQYLPKNED